MKFYIFALASLLAFSASLSVLAETKVDPQIVEMRKAISTASNLAVAVEVFMHKYNGMPGDYPPEKAKRFGFDNSGNGDKKVTNEETDIMIQHLIGANLITSDGLVDYIIHAGHSEVLGNYITLGLKGEDGKIRGAVSPDYAAQKSIHVKNIQGRDDCSENGQLKTSVEKTCLVLQQIDIRKWRPILSTFIH